MQFSLFEVTGYVHSFKTFGKVIAQPFMLQ